MIKRIDHVVIRCADINETSRFYCALGLKVRKNGEKYALYGDGFQINVHLRDKTAEPARAPHPYARLCLEVDGSLPVLVNTMKALGYQPENEYVRKSGAFGPITSCYFCDPDGNLIELCSYSGQAGRQPSSMVIS